MKETSVKPWLAAMSQRIPDAIRPKLENYISSVTEQLPCLNAFYLEGSIALGGFNERFSDIDFIAVLNRQATETEVDRLRNIHKEIEARHPRWKMSGSYIPLEDLSRGQDRVEQTLHYHDGKLRHGGYFELQSVEAWILKNHSIVLIGVKSQSLPFTVNWSLLLSRMQENMNTYWVAWTRRPDRLFMMLSDWGIQWAVLGILRQFYSFRENAITTKEGAGEYALTCVPLRWRRLIQEALNIREGKRTSTYPLRIARMIDAVKFLKFIIQVCNADPSRV